MENNNLKKILVVDDEVYIVELFTELLELEGYEVLGANNAEEALIYLRENECSLVISDYNMPGLNGVELIKTINKEFDPAPICMLVSGYIDLADDELEKYGIKNFFPKPISFEKIVETVNGCLK